MKHSVEMDSGAMIYTPNLIKIVSGIQKFMGAIHIQISCRSHKFTAGK
jgi:hypothetical protein